MGKYKRIFTIVLDSLGIGEMKDSPQYGDVGVNTLGHIAEHTKAYMHKIGKSAQIKRLIFGIEITT